MLNLCLIVNILRGSRDYDLILSLRIVFTLTKRVDPDERQHYETFHMRLHCLAKYLFRGLQYTKG